MPALDQANKQQDFSFTQLTEAYLNLKKKGVAPSIDQLVEFAPQFEDEIRTQLPMMSLLDNAFAVAEKTNSTPIPEVVAGCVILEEIGRGGMGVVYRGHQSELKRDVAVKVIKLTDEIPSQAKRFELERHAMANLEHPNIVPAYAFTQDQQYAFLVMKLIDGCGLSQLLAGEGGFREKSIFDNLTQDWNAFAAMAADVASGLHHAHENGLIHRDVKPGNLLLDAEGRVWITDFGLAKMHDFTRVISCTGDIVGTPKYMAPEQIQGATDPRSDIYSFGLTLYELAAGECARGPNWKPNQILEDSLPKVEPISSLNPNIPKALAGIIMKACQFLPEDRFQSAQELQTVLNRFIDGRVADRRKKKRKPDAVFRKEFRRKAILSIIGSIVLFAGVSYFLMADFSGKDEPEAPEIEQMPNINLIEMLAEGDGQLDPIIAEQFRDSIVKASSELDIPADEKEELVSEVNIIYDRVKKGEFRNKDWGALLDNFHDSNLGIATKIWRIVPIINASSLSSSEKQIALEAVHRFAFVATKKRMSSSDVYRLCNSLTNGRSVSSVELMNWKFSVNDLRRWVRKVDAATKPLIRPGESINVTDEIRSIFSPKSSSKMNDHDGICRSTRLIDQSRKNN